MVLKVFEFEDYRKFLLAQLAQRPKAGRGELSKLAHALGVNSSFLSQVLSGSKNISPEHAFLLAEYFSLDELEARYLSELVNLSRASKKSFKEFIKKQLAKIRNEAKSVAGLPPLDQPLDDRSQVIFYSAWTYSAIQLLTGIKGSQTAKKIAERLELDLSAVTAGLEFLVGCGLCVTDGVKYQVGARRTHVAETSPLRSRHHMNWRLQGFEKMNSVPPTERPLFFTAPMRIDEPTFQKIQTLLESMIRETNGLIDQAGDETLACLNIDWFRF